MTKTLELGYRNIADAIALLLSPVAEVVLHDLKRNTIAHICGTPSARKSGQASHLSPEDLAQPVGVIGPYRKVGEGGNQQKSVSVVLGDSKDSPAYMLCINLNTGAFIEARNALDALIHSQTTELTEHFTESWQDKINVFVKDYLSQRNSSLKQLDRQEKKKLILALKAHGAFKGKNAAQYIADSLKISRATVYNSIQDKG